METSEEPHESRLLQGACVHGYSVRYFRLWDPETPLYSVPLGSPSPVSKRSYVHVPGVPRVVRDTVLVDVRAGLRVPGRVYGWVYRVGIPGGYYPGTLPGTRLLALSPEEGQRPQGAGPPPGGRVVLGVGRPLREP